MAKKGNYPIPFDQNGNQQHYAESWWTRNGDGTHRREGPNWRENAPFVDTITFDDFSRGRSAAYFHFKRSDGTEVCMFMAELAAAMPHLVRGQLTGTFQFTKRGQNYGIKLMEPAQ